MGEGHATMEQALLKLTTLEGEAKSGKTLFWQAAIAAQAQASARAADQQSAAIRNAAGRYATVILLDPSGASESLHAAMQRLRVAKLRPGNKSGNRHGPFLK
jgi:exonuclease SbcC